MSVICFASLKGGVGKTSLSINVSHAFAERGCQTLLIDCDPTAHASRFFKYNKIGVAPPPVEGAPGRNDRTTFPEQSPLARLFFAQDLFEECSKETSVAEAAHLADVQLQVPVRDQLELIPASAELRYFHWGRGARFFSTLFPRLIDELKNHYDHIIIDTAPDFNIITRNSIGVADLVIVPVDSSEMSIHCLEEIVACSAHMKRPMWGIIRSMVNRQASRVHQLANSRLQKNLTLAEGEPREDTDEADVEDTGSFLKLLRQRDQQPDSSQSDYVEERDLKTEERPAAKEPPIYLLNSLVYRTEQQNKLTFLGRTSFDMKATAKLAEQYRTVAREIESVLSICSDIEPERETPNMNEFLSGDYAAP